MYVRKKFLLLVLLIVLALILSGCVKYNNLSKNTIELNDDFVNYYVFKENDKINENSLIFIGGSGYSSVLGLKQHGIWKEITMAHELQNTLLSTFDILVPEKKNIKMGKNYEQNKKIIENYTLEQRISTAKLVIDKYLANNKYKKVILVGFSEGGYILPKLYFSLNNKQNISGLVILSSGGFSQYESFKTLKNKDFPYPEGYKKELNKIDKVAQDIKNHPNSTKKKYLGNTYKRWSSFMFYCPLIDLINIDIPILMAHGNKDMMSAVESSRIVRKEFNKLNKNNLTYIEYKDKDHAFNGKFKPVIKNIEEWFIEKVK